MNPETIKLLRDALDGIPAHYTARTKLAMFAAYIAGHIREMGEQELALQIAELIEEPISRRACAGLNQVPWR